MPYRHINDLYDSLSSLFGLDPNLLYNFVYICPKNNLDKLFLKILPYISMSFVAYLLDNSREINREEVRSIISLYSVS